MNIKTRILHSFIDTVGGFISSRPLSAIKECVLFREDQGTLWLFAEGEEGGIRIKTEIPIAQNVNVAVPYVMIAQTLRELIQEEITLHFDTEKCILEIHSDNGKYKIACEKGIDFPGFPRRPEVFQSLDGEALVKVLSKATICCSRDEIRYGMNGVHIGGTSQTPVLFATDGYRAGRFVTEKLSGISTGITLHRKSCDRMLPVLQGKGEVQMGFDGYKFFVLTENIMMHGIIIKDPFPDCEPFFKNESKIQINLSAKSLKGSLKRAGVFAERATPAVIFKADGQSGFLSGSDAITDKNFQEEFTIEHQGNDISIAFNNNMLLEILQVIEGETVRMEMTDNTKPILVSGDIADHKLILMPLRMERL